MKPAGAIAALLAMASAVGACERLKSCGGKGASEGAGDASDVAAGSGAIGIPECDAYLARFSCFLEKTAPGDKARTMRAMRSRFAEAAADLSHRGSTAIACAQQIEQMETLFEQQGCTGSGERAPGAAKAASHGTLASSGDAHDAHRGKCHRGDCALDAEYCCENASTSEQRCQLRETRAGRGVACSADGAWRVAMECVQYEGCGASQKCCVTEPARGFFQTVCADTCGDGDESCTGKADGACKTPGTVCVANPGSRAGGHCVAETTAAAPVNAAPCGPCEGRSGIGACVPLCDDDQRCADDDCVDEE